MKDKDHLSTVGEYESFRKANEHGLVVLSMGLAYWTFKEGRRFVLHVETEHAEDVLEQFRKYDQENRFWPPWVSREQDETVSIPALVIYAVVLLAFFIGQQRENEWFVSRGAVDSILIFRQGEWWRAATALTLHSDFPHLVSNLFGGALFGIFVNRSLGSGLSWFLILLSGIAGNLLSAAITFPLARQSIGASTAIFGALGILAGCAMTDARPSKWRQRQYVRAVPLVGALTLLALLGTGDVRTDVLAHFCGFSAGIVLGVGGGCASRYSPIQAWLEKTLLSSCLIILALAWIAAVYAVSLGSV